MIRITSTIFWASLCTSLVDSISLNQPLANDSQGTYQSQLQAFQNQSAAQHGNSQDNQQNGAKAKDGDQTEPKQRVCKALAISSAVQKATYASGAIYGFLQKGDAEQLGWDVISGISSGGHLASIIGMWPRDRGPELATKLAEIIEEGSNLQITKEWGQDSGFHFSKFDDTNYRNSVKKFVEDSLDLDVGFHRKVTIGISHFDLSYNRVDLDKIRPINV